MQYICGYGNCKTRMIKSNPFRIKSFGTFIQHYTFFALLTDLYNNNLLELL